MDPVVIFCIIVSFVAFEYLAGRVLEYLNRTYWSSDLPEEVKGIYDPDEYKKSQDYLRTNSRFSFLTDSFSFLLILLMLFLGGFAWLDGFARQYTQHPILMALLFFGALGLASDILSTPFSVYRTFVIEERFGFNKTTIKTFIFDKLKGWMLGILIGGGILALIVYIYQSTGNLFWIIAWAAITVFSVFMALFYSNLIVPLFNKQVPLEDGELKDAISSFANKVGFRLSNIFVIDGSKRSTKANAYFTGLGRKKRIVLYDTLIEDHSKDEVVAVLAHEIGHYKKKHTTLGLGLSVLQTGFLLFVLSLFLGNPALSSALGASEPSFHMSVLAFGILYSPISWVLSLVGNVISRKHEFAADNYAGTNFDPKPLKDALKKLSVKNLSNLKPHPAYVFIYYSHPPLLQRLANLDNVKPVR